MGESRAPPKILRRPREESMVQLRCVTDLEGWSNPHTGAEPRDMGVSEKIVYPIVPNGFADHEIPMKNG